MLGLGEALDPGVMSWRSPSLGTTVTSTGEVPEGEGDQGQALVWGRDGCVCGMETHGVSHKCVLGLGPGLLLRRT